MAPTRIVGFNSTLPASLHEGSTAAEPAVQMHVSIVDTTEYPGLGETGVAATITSLPTSNNNGLKDLELAPLEPPAEHLKDGIIVRHLDLLPGAEIPFHRFTTTDYVFVVEGVLKVLTPAEPFTDGKVTEDNVQVTVVKAGDVYIQRGTLHSWKNDSDKPVRGWSVTAWSEPNNVAVEGSGKRHDLPDISLF